MSSGSRFIAAAGVALLVSVGSAGFLAARRSQSHPKAPAPTVATEPTSVASPAPLASPAPVESPVVERDDARAVALTPAGETTLSKAPAPKVAAAAPEKARASNPAPAARPSRPASSVATRPAPSQPEVARDVPPTPRPVAEAPPSPAPVAKPTADPVPLPAPVPARAPEVTPPVEIPTRRLEEHTVKAESVVGIRLEQSLSSATAKLEDRVVAVVSRDVIVDGRTVLPIGTRLEGNVTLVQPGSKFKGRARLGIRFHTLVLADGLRVPVQTEALFRDGDSATRSTATKVGTGAAAGAILGAVLGGKRGAILGAGAGAGGGTVAVMAGDAKEAVLESGSQLTMRVTSPVTVMIERQ
jgi:hypothetical protein